jgi:hypothetical protein
MDRYTKAVLTIIAVALVSLALEHAFPSAQAQMGNCGVGKKEPCAVYLVYDRGTRGWESCVGPDGKNHC